MNRIRTYSELMSLKTFEERFNYLKLNGQVGEVTFGWKRYLNQNFYKSKDLWLPIRDRVIIRDNGCDLGLSGYDLFDQPIYIHHMNPISDKDIENMSENLINPEYLICTSLSTHNAIHYGNLNSLIALPTERTPNDTCPWRS